MFCVIQEIILKKPNPYGAYKRYEVSYASITTDGKTQTHYGYYPDSKAGRFERPHREAFKISVHESYRENGKVCKRQCVIGTIDYYEFADGGFIWDVMDEGAGKAARLFQWDYNAVIDCIDAKITPLMERIQAEFEASEEGQAEAERRRILERHRDAKDTFVRQYGCVGANGYTYECIYDALGELRDPAYLQEIKDTYETFCSYARQSQRTYSRQSRKKSSQDWRSYLAGGSGTYTDDEKGMLKKFYKALSMKYHPDKNPEQDTTKEMQLLNRLKGDWGV